ERALDVEDLVPQARGDVVDRGDERPLAQQRLDPRRAPQERVDLADPCSGVAQDGLQAGGPARPSPGTRVRRQGLGDASEELEDLLGRGGDSLRPSSNDGNDAAHGCCHSLSRTTSTTDRSSTAAATFSATDVVGLGTTLCPPPSAKGPDQDPDT